MTELIDHICAARLEKELETQLSEPTPDDDEITIVSILFYMKKNSQLVSIYTGVFTVVSS